MDARPAAPGGDRLAGARHQRAGAGADEVRLEARASWLAARGFNLYAGMSAAWTNQLPFAGWQAQALLGLRWADRGSF